MEDYVQASFILYEVVILKAGCKLLRDWDMDQIVYDLGREGSRTQVCYLEMWIHGAQPITKVCLGDLVSKVSHHHTVQLKDLVL